MLPASQKNILVVQPVPLLFWLYYEPVSGRIRVKVIIERATCVSCGSCWETCPGLFEQDPDDSFSRIIEKYRIDGNIAEGTPPGGSCNLCTGSIRSLPGANHQNIMHNPR